MSGETAWPFQEWLDVAVRIFGLTPQSFWAMSLLDWLTILEQRAGHSNMQPMTRQSLSSLMDNFPDGTE